MATTLSMPHSTPSGIDMEQTLQALLAAFNANDNKQVRRISKSLERAGMDFYTQSVLLVDMQTPEPEDVIEIPVSRTTENIVSVFLFLVLLQ